MIVMLRKVPILQCSMASRAFSCTPALETKTWRASRGLPANRNSEGVLTDKPDYTFLDGRPTPLLHKQKLRMLKQREHAAKIVQMCSELEFAKDRYQNMLQADADEKQRIIDNRLKAKGKTMYDKSS